MATDTVKSPPPMRFQDRDGRILETVYAFDGVMARRQLKDLFWPTAFEQAMERRLSLLKRNEYLDWPSRTQRRTKPIPEPIVWLGWRGALHVAGRDGKAVDPPAIVNENQLRELQQTLRDHGVRWAREPRWIQLAHDLAVGDVRMAVERAAGENPALTLEEWIPEGDFISNMDTVEFRIIDEDGKERMEKRGVRPDGFFLISDRTRRIRGNDYRARMLLELDHSTHPIRRFAERALLYAAYITSPQYKERFGFQSGSWLVVTKSKVRLEHLKEHTKKALGSRAFFFWFTTFKQIVNGNPLTDPIWLRADWKYPGYLFAPE